MRDVTGPRAAIPEPHRRAVPRIGEPAGRCRQHRRQRRAACGGLRSVGPMTDPRGVSFWLDSLPADHNFAARPQLPGDVTADVAIVGAGYTGLWTAYYLHQIDPSLRIAIVEAEFAGFGASGRNGGWLSALLPMSFETMAAAARPRPGRRHAAHDARRRRRGRQGHDEGRHRLPPRQGRISQPRPNATPGPARARPAAVLPLVGFRRGGLPLVAVRRGVGAHQRHQGARRRLHAALRCHPSSTARPRSGRDGRTQRHDDLRTDTRASNSAIERCVARPERCRPTSSSAPPRGSPPGCPATVAPSHRSTR